MNAITRDTTLAELAALVSGALEDAGITATLSGGAAVSLYSENEYESWDLDFVSSGRLDAIAEALAPLGFEREGSGREFGHPESAWFVEFPPGPIAFGETTFDTSEMTVFDTDLGPIRIVAPTHIVMDRLAAFTHWHDRPSLDQALTVARRREIDWPALRAWAAREGIAPTTIENLEKQSVSDSGDAD